MSHPYSRLLSETTLANGTTLSNRFVLSPMTTNSSTSEGHITQADLAYAERRAASAPLQVTGAAYINTDGQLFEYGFSVANDDCIPGLRQMAHTMQSAGAKAILQLTHAGRFSNQTLLNTGRVFGPSPMTLHSPIPHEVIPLTTQQIDTIIEDYVAATRRAIQAGFSGIEISSAQRLLLQTFFSTFSNQRTDQYGAQTLKNRARLILEVLSAVYQVIQVEAPEGFIIGYRATPEETRGAEVGYSIEEFNQLIDWILDIVPLDYLAIASWGQSIYLNTVRTPGDHTNRLVNQVVHEHLGGRIPLMATGGINTPEKALEALQHAELIGLSSPLVADPDFANKLALNLPESIQLDITMDDLERLAIPSNAFKDIVRMMDYGKGLPQSTRDQLRQLSTSPQAETVHKTSVDPM